MAFNYEERKKDHIQLALLDKNKIGDTGLSKITLIHSALPEIDWEDVDLSAVILGKKRPTPFFVSAMTGGHDQSLAINLKIAGACQKRGWMMGAGSQRKQLNDPKAHSEWLKIREKFPDLCLFGNLGLSQLIHTPIRKIEELVRGLQAMVIHTNPLQECLQPEGTPHFKGGKKALAEAVKNLSVPVCLKETGCGFSYSTLQSLCGMGLSAVDVSGFGGTHWGRIEGDRSEGIFKKASQTYAEWGNSTLSSLLDAKKCKNRDFEIWAGGGLRSGLDGAKCLALGASAVGFASVILEKALVSEEELEQKMSLLENELKIALFCTGSPNISKLKNQWKRVSD